MSQDDYLTKTTALVCLGVFSCGAVPLDFVGLFWELFVSEDFLEFGLRVGLEFEAELGDLARGVDWPSDR